MTLSIFALNDLVNYQKKQIRSRNLSKKFAMDLPMMIYAADKEESISLEETTATKLIQVIDGVLAVTTESDDYTASQGELVVIPPETFHELRAITPCKFLQIETKE